MIKNVEQRILWIDLLKIFACLCVIFTHLLNYYSISTDSYLFCTFYIMSFCLSKMDVSIFLMISGALLLSKNYNIKDVLKKIIRVLIPLIIMTLIVCKSFNLWESYSIKSFFEKPINEYLWYLYAIIGIYLITPLVQKMLKNLKSRDYIYLFCVCFIVPNLINYINYLFKINISSLLLSGCLPILLVYYIMGYYLSRLKKNKKNIKIAWIVFIFSYLFYVLLFLLIYLKEEKIIILTTDCSNLFVGLMSISTFYIFKFYFVEKKFKYKNIIKNISSSTFGIYLVHVLVMLKLINSKFFIYFMEYNKILSSLVLEVLIFLISLLIVYFLKKIPLIRKFL